MIKYLRYLKQGTLLIAIILSFFLLESAKTNVDAIICASGFTCTNTNQWINSFSRIQGGACAYRDFYTCNGNNSSCEEDYVDTFSDSGCNTAKSSDLGCCVSGPKCNNCSPAAAPSCPTGTTTTNTGDSHSTTQSCCDRGVGCNPRNNCNTRDCFCTLCTLPECGPTYATSTQNQGSLILSCQNSPQNDSRCAFRNRTCYCFPCTPADCPFTLSNTDLNQGTSSFVSACTNDCGWNNYRTCFCRDCNLPIPSGTTLSDTGRQSTDPANRTTRCSKGIRCTDKTGTLYCTRCNPPSCEPTYTTDSTLGYGSVTLSCNNTLSTCGSETRTCYIDACSNCSLPNCPFPLSNSDTSTPPMPNMILNNFRSCTKGSPCGGSVNYGQCYEPVSPQPTASLQIYPDATNIFDFFSSTHTGTRMPEYNLNDPIRMTATYTDINGATDIEAVSVWFRDTAITGEITSPLWIDTATNPSQVPRAQSNMDWGFMMRREGSSWRPYVPSYPSLGTPRWVRALFTNNTFVISGPGGLQMVRVTIGHNLQPSVASFGSNVVLPFQLSFNFTEAYESVSQVTYQTYLMGNDVFSFTPNDNYSFSVDSYWAPGQLRYRTSPTPAQLHARQWGITGYPWVIDKDAPSVQSLSVTVISETNLRLDWTVADTREIYAVVGNIYASISMPSNPPAIAITGSNLDINSPHNLVTDDTDLGRLNTGYAFRRLDIGGTSYSGSANIDIGENKEGSLIIYLTVFDKAGNMHSRPLTFSLGDWIITHGGFAYSSNGKDYEMKTIGNQNAWNNVSALSGMIPSHADVSTELFGDSNPSGTLPTSLDTSSLLNSYHMRPFSMNTHITSFYEELKRAYNDREIEGKVDLTTNLPPVTALNGNLTNIPACLNTSSVCILKHTGNLHVGETNRFVCDNWGVFFVDGDLIIHKGIENVNKARDACIFVVSGNVTVKEGEKASSESQLQYDEIHSYILADGSITIDPELGLFPKYDGVFVGGGLHSLGGLNMNRSLKLVDRNTYPALVVKYHSKYSVLSNLVFGSQVDILKRELGFKPF